MAKGEKVSITERALVQRINRKLANEGQQGRLLKRTRGQRALLDLGEYYVLDIDTNLVTLHHVNIEVLGRKFEALQEWEKLEGGK